MDWFLDEKDLRHERVNDFSFAYLIKGRITIFHEQYYNITTCNILLALTTEAATGEVCKKISQYLHGNTCVLVSFY